MHRTLVAGLLLGAISVVAGEAQAAGPARAAPAADLVLKNGKIYTPGGWVSAMTVSRGVILELGDDAVAAPHVGPKTKVIDLKGRTVLPGLHDMHIHATGSGMAEMQCRLPQGSNAATVLELTAACVKGKKAGEWVTGRAYDPASLGVTPHKSMLDKVAPNNPVVFTDISVHSSWANSAALKVAGITRDTPNPPNGIIERDANGEPTGVLRESAGGLVSRHIPPASADDTKRALTWALHTTVAQGITAFDDAGLGEDVAIAYAELADAGVLKQRVRGCLVYNAAALIARRQLYARDRFSPTCVKIALDGVPTDGHTAAMLEDYLPIPGQPDDGRSKGLTMVGQEDLNVIVTRFDAMGMTVKMHAAGDAAVRIGLNAIEAARKANGTTGIIHDMAHNSFVHMDDIRRARGLNAAFEFSPYIWFDQPITADIKKAVPAHLMERWTPIKDALDAGALAVPGSDWAVVPSVNPWIAIETMVTRQPPGARGPMLGAQERITLKQAVDMYTINSARQMYVSDKLGTIEKGKLADLVVIDRNIFDVPIGQVHQTKVEYTIINGEVAYDATKPFPARP